MSDRRQALPGRLDSAASRNVAWTARALAAVGFAVALAMLVGCTSGSPGEVVDPIPSPLWSGSPPSTPDETERPSSTPAATASQAPASGTSAPDGTGLGPDTLGVVVATDGLRVRSLPTVGDESARLVPLLAEGARFYVVDGPVTADGYVWYLIQPYGGDERLPFGWVAGGSRDGEPWIRQVHLGCDTVAPSAEGLVSGEPLEHLFCSLAGEQPRTRPPGPDIAVEGTVYCTYADDHWGWLSGPEWIDQLGYCELRTNGGAIRLPGRPMMGLLDAATNPVEGRYALVGHFDDAGARDCRGGAFEGSDPPDAAEVVLLCRTYFVVTRVTAVP
jgi:hypothetical protein